MRKVVVLLLTVFLAGCSWLPGKQPAALKINTIPKATVFVDGKHYGNTPFINEELTAGEITLKLVSEDQTNPAAAPWEGLIELTAGVVTVINHEFATDTKTAAGEQLTMQPNNQTTASLSVISIPDAAIVRLDGESKGFTPLVVDQLTEGDHQLSVASPGYIERTVNIKAQNGYRVTVSVQLAKEGSLMPGTTDGQTPEATPSAEATGAAEATKSGTKTLTPTKKPSVTVTKTPTPGSKTPTPTKKAAAGTPEKPYVKINDTPTGWLRVRAEPSVSAAEVAKVNPGETYALKDSQSGWYQIEYEAGKLGWIAGQYAEKYE